MTAGLIGSVAEHGSLLPEEPIPEGGDDQGDPRGNEGPDGLEAGDGLERGAHLAAELGHLHEVVHDLDVERLAEAVLGLGGLLAQKTGQVPFSGG